jgi:glycosyltransferase involved in cell wall biosynthesis
MAGVIAHEWISRTGGSEKVLDAMVAEFPDAEVWCPWNDVPDVRYPGHVVRESWLARTPLRRSKPAALPFMPLAWRTRRRSDADWVLASSHAFAHHVSARWSRAEVKKYAYVYTPARYIWTPELDMRGDRRLARLMSPAMKAVDRRRAQEVLGIAAISEFVRDRIARAWDRDSVVIYPPVDVHRIQSVRDWTTCLSSAEQRVRDSLPRPFILGASRFIPYKQLAAVIDAGAAADIPVVVAGSGPEERRLRSHAEGVGVPVAFVIDPSDDMLFSLYQEATALVFPALEDFGIMPVEAMALGTPVIGLNKGGVAETVQQGSSGVLIDSFRSSADVRAAVEAASRMGEDGCRQRAAEFDVSRFRAQLRRWLESGTVPSSEGPAVSGTSRPNGNGHP